MFLGTMRRRILVMILSVSVSVNCVALDAKQAEEKTRVSSAVQELEEKANDAFVGRYDEKTPDALEKLTAAFEVLQAASQGKASAADTDVKLKIRYQKLIVRFHQWKGDKETTYKAFKVLVDMVATPRGYGVEAAAHLVVKNADSAFEKRQFDDALCVYRILADASWAEKLEETNYSRLKIGRCQDKKGANGAAFETYRALINDAPKSDWAGEAMLYAEDTYLARRSYDEAIASYKGLLEANPKCRMRPYLLERMAYNLIKKKNYEEAERALNQVIKEYAGVDVAPGMPEGAHVLFAKSYLQMIKERREAEPPKN